MTEEVSQLSERESEILRLLAKGSSNQQIANELSISVNTVKVHVRNIFGKINVASRTEATLFAVRSGLVEVVRQPERAPEAQALVEPELVEAPAPPADLIAPVPDALPEASAGDLFAAPAESIALDPAPPQAPEAFAKRGRRGLIWIAALALLLVALVIAVILGRGLNAPAATATPTVQPAPRWHRFSPLPQPRAFFALSTYNRQLYAIGGRSGTSLTAAVERFNPDVDTWVQLTPKPTPVEHMQAVVIGGKLYVPGGELADGSISKIFEAYDPSRDSWERLPDLPEARSRYALVGFEGKMYLFGGWDGQKIHAEVWRYDPDTRQWETKIAPMPTARRSAAAGVVEGRVFVVGGENEHGALSVNERFDPSLSAQGGQVWATAVPLPQPAAHPTTAAIANLLLVFDPQLPGGLQYFPVRDSWQPFPLAQAGGTSLQASPLDNNVLLIQSGEAEHNTLTGYPVYTMSLPIIP